jgi:uncharacterized protein YjcR
LCLKFATTQEGARDSFAAAMNKVQEFQDEIAALENNISAAQGFIISNDTRAVAIAAELSMEQFKREQIQISQDFLEKEISGIDTIFVRQALPIKAGVFNSTYE